MNSDQQIIANLKAELKKVKAERNNAIKDLTKVLTNSHKDYSICDFCKYHIKCKGKNCENYIEGKGCIDTAGKEFPDWKWSCMDFTYGTCDKLINTPCNGCDFKNNFKYRGLKDN